MPSDNSVPPRRPRRTPKPHFMKYPHPTHAERSRILAHLDAVSGARAETRSCIANLLAYRAVRTGARLPRGPSAAVLVPLFVGRSGDVYVLLSRRSDALKTFAGDTALPGGKIDALDGTVEDTARREAFEEIGLPQDRERVPLLCVMEPHLAKGEILVTPVVVLILDHSLQPNLNSFEVTSIFAQPLIAFLSSAPHLSGGRTADPNHPYHTFTDLPWSGGGTVRLHRFLTGREREGVKPVFGLTASILIKTATIGYGRPPDFEVQPSNAPTPAQQIAYALLTPANPLRVACAQEGIDADRAAARMLRPPVAANAARTIEWEKIGVEWKNLMDGDDAARVDVREQARQDVTPDLAKLGAFLDRMRDQVNARMKEVKGDERKLAKARRGYPKIVSQVKKHIEGLRGEDGEFDPKALFALIPKAGQEGLERGIEAGKEEIKGETGEVDDAEGRDQGVEKGREGVRKGLEEVMRHAGKGGDDHNPEQTIRKKRDAKL